MTDTFLTDLMAVVTRHRLLELPVPIEALENILEKWASSPDPQEHVETDAYITERGFEGYAKIVDRYGSTVRVQESSLAFERCVWIFCEPGDDPNYTNPSPHLTVEQAKVIRDGLDRFIEGGE